MYILPVNTFYKYLTLIGIIVGSTSLLSVEVHCQSQISEKKITKILFVGNSYVYSNNLPEILEVITNNSSNDSLDTEMVTFPASTLQIQWELGEALEKIQSKNWDYVILQEHSTLGPRLINGQLRINDPENFYKYVRLFYNAITKNSSETLLFLTWARKSTPEHQPKINNAYFNIGNELDIKVIPVGTAWQEVLNNYDDIDLYWNDGSHPTFEGSYLSACVIYSSLFEKSPVDLIYNFEVNQVSESGKIDEDSSKSIIEMDSDKAKILQSAAWEVHNNFIVSTEVVFPVLEDILYLNQVRIEDDDFVNELIGDWEGQLVLFEYQTDLFLEFELAEDSLYLSLEIAKNGFIHHTIKMSIYRSR
jgi:hypothetical protein